MEDIGKYKVVRLLGEGGMGRVYEAVDPVIGRRVAIKRLSADIVGDAEARARFFREAQAAGQLSHPNLITIHDIGEADGHPYIVMEYLEGADLNRTLKGESLSLDTKLRIMTELCEGLAFAHSHDVIHRDIKPANIFITSGGRVKILDFGLARGSVSTVTRTGKVLGTPHYMAPEQIRGDDLDHRADIFSAGVVFYELISGRKAFDGESVATTIYKVLQTEPDSVHRLNSAIPPQLSAIVERAMAKERTERYQTTNELLTALRTGEPGIDPDRTRSFSTAATIAVPPALGSAASSAVPPPATAQVGRRTNWAWAVAAVIVLAAIGGIADLTLLRPKAPVETPVTQAVAPPVTQAPPLPLPSAVSQAPAATEIPARTPAPAPREAPRPLAVAAAAPSPSAQTAVEPPSPAPAPAVAPAAVAAPVIVAAPVAPPEPRPEPVEAPAPAPAVAPPPPVASAAPAPREPAPSAEAIATAAIEDVVSRYQAALEARDLAGLKRIWPALGGRQEDAIRSEFQNARAINVTIDGQNVRVNGNSATAVSRRNYQVTTTDGRTLRTATRMTITLTRRDGGWAIENIGHEATR